MQVGKTGSTYVKSTNVVSQDGSKTIRQDATTGVGLETKLTISHVVIGKGGAQRRRSLYRVDQNGSAADGSAVTDSFMIIRDTPLKAGASLLTKLYLASILSGLAENNSLGDLQAWMNGEI